MYEAYPRGLKTGWILAGHLSSVSAPNLMDTSMFCRLPKEFCRNVVDKPIHTVQSALQTYELGVLKAPLQSQKSCLFLALANNII